MHDGIGDGRAHLLPCLTGGGVETHRVAVSLRRSSGLTLVNMCAVSKIEEAPSFQHLVDDQRAELHAHCYRMLGSLHDADDALQDTLLRAWRALPKFPGRSSLRTWLYRIATNVCLDAIARRPKRVLPIDYGPVMGAGGDEADSPSSSPCGSSRTPTTTIGVADGAAGPEARYERREALELAFVAALQHLPPAPASRADLARRARVLGQGGSGVARDDRRVGQRRAPARPPGGRRAAARTQPAGDAAGARRPSPARARGALRRCLRARRGRRDPRHAGRGRHLRDAAVSRWYSGPRRGRRLVADAGRSAAAAAIRRDARERAAALGHVPARPRDGGYLPLALDVLTLRGNEIAAVTAFRTPAIFPRFGLPDRLAV